LSQRDLTTTFAENILKQIENEEPLDSKTKLHEALNVDAMNNNRNIKSPTIKCEATSTSVVTQALLNKHDIKSEPVVKIEKLVEFDSKVEFSNKMTAKEVYECVKSMDNSECSATVSVLSPELPPPSPPENPINLRLTREQLQPPTPSVFLENKKHAFSPQLQEFCLKHPIAVVRQMASALKLGNPSILFFSYQRQYFLCKYLRTNKCFKIIIFGEYKKFLQLCSLVNLFVNRTDLSFFVTLILDQSIKRY
jgi:histone demethylase